MPGCCFQEKWLYMPNYNNWVARASNDNFAKCTLCKKNIRLITMGESALLRSHAAGKKHTFLLASSKRKGGIGSCFSLMSNDVDITPMESIDVKPFVTIESNDIDITPPESIDVKPFVTIEGASPSSSSQAPPEPTILPVANGAAFYAPNGQPSHIDEQDIMTWTKGEITMWLTKYSLENSSLLYLSGEEIIFLHKLRYEAPEFFYRCLESKFHLESLLDLSRASDALADLTW